MTTDNSTAPVQGLTNEQIDALNRSAQDAAISTGIPPHRALVRAALAAAPHTATPVVQPVVPADVAQAARLFVAADYRGPLFMARKVFDWVASLPAAPASDADSMQGSQPTKEN